MKQPMKITGRNLIAVAAVAILFLWVAVCFCSLLPLVLFLSFMFNAVLLGAGLFSSLAQEREKRTIDALRLTQLTSLDILRYKALHEFKAWKTANICFIALAGGAAWYSNSPLAWGLTGAAVLACGGLLSMALALAVSTRCETTSSAVVTGWVSKGVWLVGLPILDYVVEAVLVMNKDFNFFSYLDPAWVYGTVVSGLIYETNGWSVVGLLLGGFATAAVAGGLVWQSSRIIDSSFESSATLEDRNRHSVYSKRFAFNMHQNPFMVRELAWQVRTGAGSWPGYAVFVTLFLAPFLYGLAQQHKAHEVKPVKVVRQSVANPTQGNVPQLPQTDPQSPDYNRPIHRSPQPAIRYHDHICLSQMLGLPVPVQRSYQQRNWDDNRRIVVNEDGKSVLVDDHQVDQMRQREANRQSTSPRPSLKRTQLESELDRGLLTGLLLTLMYLFIRGGAFMSGAVTSEKERRAWDQIALTGTTPTTYLRGKLAGVLYYPMKQLLYTSPILLLFAVFGGISLIEILLVVPLLLTSFWAAANVGLLATATRSNSHQAQGLALTVGASILLLPLVTGGWVLSGLVALMLLTGSALSQSERLYAAAATALWVKLVGASASPAAAVMMACEYVGYGPFHFGHSNTSPTVALFLGTVTMALVAFGAYSLSVRSLNEGGSVKA
jgi:ABC-2 family transporter